MLEMIKEKLDCLSDDDVEIIYISAIAILVVIAVAIAAALLSVGGIVTTCFCWFMLIIIASIVLAILGSAAYLAIEDFIESDDDEAKDSN